MIESGSIDRRFVTALAAADRQAQGQGKLCSVCVQVLPVDGAAISLTPRSGHPEMLCASDETAERLEELQLTLGEGPGVEAFTAGGPVLVPDLAADGGTRWPVFAEETATTAVGSIFAFPLHIGAIRLGALDLYRTVPAPLERIELAAALRVSEIVTSVLLASASGAGAGPALDRWLEPSPASREINQATGMVLAQLSVSAEEAYARLRAHAFSSDRRIGDVARDVVERRLRFDRDDP